MGDVMAPQRQVKTAEHWPELIRTIVAPLMLAAIVGMWRTAEATREDIGRLGALVDMHTQQIIELRKELHHAE